MERERADLMERRSLWAEQPQALSTPCFDQLWNGLWVDGMLRPCQVQPPERKCYIKPRGDNIKDFTPGKSERIPAIKTRVCLPALMLNRTWTSREMNTRTNTCLSIEISIKISYEKKYPTRSAGESPPVARIQIGSIFLSHIWNILPCLSVWQF